MKKKIFTMLVALFAMTTGAWAQEQSETIATTAKIVEGTHFTISNDGFYADGDGMEAVGGITVTPKNGETITKVVISCTYQPENVNDGNTSVSSGTKEITNGGGTITVTGVNASTFTFTCSESGPQFGQFVVYYTEPGTAVLNADGTEAVMEMPTYDVTVDYELVRDMSVDMTVSVEDAQGKSSIRLKKTDNGKYQPADMTPQQMAGLITVTDDIEQQELTNNTDYTVSIFAVDDNDQPTGTAIAFADLEPGRYVAFATAKEGTIYDGQTLPSNVFKLFVGYEVEVEAGQYATFYKDEKLTVEESSTTGELYTISSVSADEAVLSAQIGVAPANTPLLVYNSGSEKKTILLIPTEDPADNVTAYSGFKGTLVASTIAASTENQTNYALNGTQFVWVKRALAVPANKCWLEVPNAIAGVKAINIVFDETGIETVDSEQATTGDWYDLNGRKVQTPTRKGIYINNGRKVVIK